MGPKRRNALLVNTEGAESADGHFMLVMSNQTDPRRACIMINTRCAKNVDN